MKRFFKWLKGLFSTKFIVPEVNKKLAQAIDDKIARKKVEAEKVRKEHDQILMEYLRTYFDKTYSCDEDMAYAYDVCNRGWKLHCKQVNMTSKVINLNKHAFENEAKAFIQRIKDKAAMKEVAANTVKGGTNV